MLIFIELIVAILLGCLLGILTGITPGLHINLVSVIILSAIPFFLTKFSIISVAVIIISMSIVHTFTDFLPSIFLGAANDDTALGVLPGHKFLMQGKSLLAVKLTVIGGLFSLLFSLILIPLFLLITAPLYKFLQPFMAYILIAASLFLILRQKDKNKILWSSIVFFLSGTLGLIVLNSAIKEPLLPMLSGIFGVSTLLYSLNQKTKIPYQHQKAGPVKLKEITKPVFAGTIASMLVSIFPAVGPAHAAIISGQFFKKISSKGYLIMLGGINTVSMMFSLVTLYTIQKARNGSIISVQKMLENFGAFTTEEFVLFIIVAVIAAAIASFITIELAAIFAEKISNVNYKAISIAVILFVAILSFVFSGLVGLLILLVATAIGLIPNAMKMERTSAMGCLLLPVIVYLL